ncbi:MAG TPA: hypothetical protein VGF07_02470 [Stellaceae bacterium]
MAYIFKGRLCGYICAECPEPLSGVTVRLYRSRSDQNVTALAAADPKQTLSVLGDAEANAKSSALLAEGTTDAAGTFSISIDEGRGYRGEAFEIDIYCGTVPHGKPTPQPPQPRQLSITTLQPAWRQVEGGFVAAWEYCIPQRIWCYFRGLFGAWTICGRVTVCDTKNPVGGVRVRAFDVDWLQDDDLGAAVTDGDGRFRIDYTTADFQKTIFSPGLNIELIGGPDLYFRVETLANTPLLVEPRARGRQPDRENAGPCFCVDLCLEQQPQDGGDPLPVFTAVGGYQYLTDIDSTPPGNGLTVADNRAFFATMRLNGILSKKLNGNPMQYRFEIATTDPDGQNPVGWTPVTPAQIARTVIGIWEHFAPAFPGDPNPIKTKLYTVNGTAGPNELVAGFTADGFVQVPQESNVFGPTGFFQPNGNMINLESRSIAAWGSVNETGVLAGHSATSGGQPLAQDRHFAIRMKVREQGNLGAGSDAGVCQHIAIDNTGYDNVVHHPSWAGFTDPPGTIGVRLLDIQQLLANGCVEITNALDVLFTAAHPNLGGVSVSMTGPGGPYSFTLPAAVAGERFGTATPNFTVAALQPCAYIVTLAVQLLLTTGDGVPSDLFDQIAFCKQ